MSEALTGWVNALGRLPAALADALRRVGNRAALSLQQQRLADFAMASGDWLWETDESGRLAWLSSADQSRAGASAPWVLGQTMDDERILDAAGEPVVPPQSLQQLLQRRGPFERVITLCDTPRGRLYVSHSAVCRYESDRWCGYRGTARNVSSAVLGQRERQAAASVLHKLAGQIPDLLFQFRMHADGRIELPYASERIREIFEFDPEDVVRDASGVIDRVHPEDTPRVLAAIAQSASDMTVWQQTFRVVLPVRGERMLSGRSKPERLDDGSALWHGVITDVTQQMHEAQRVQALARERDAANRAAALRSEIMSRVSHELRTPLNAILGFAQLIERNRGDDAPASAVTSAMQIQRAGKHLLSLINDMLDLASLEAKGFDGGLRPLRIAPLVERCVALMAPHAQLQQVSLSTVLAAALPAVSADLRALKQVLFNLIGNAIKFSSAGSMVEIEVGMDDDPEWVIVAVLDHGPGIPADRLPSLFQPFTRLINKGVRKEGTGLGLAISQRLAHAMGGRIDVGSQLGEGSVFTLRLRTSSEAAQPTGETAFDELDAAPTRPRLAGTVLYIEDEPINALLMQQFCAAFPGLHLTVATSGGEGLRVARELAPDLVLLDMNLPDMDGHQVLQALRADAATAGIAVVALSADALEDHARAARDAGFDDYWTKPIDFALVEQGLADWLGRGRS